MKLVFPGGEHAAVDLADGATSIGAAADCAIVVGGDGVAAHHCEIVIDDAGVRVRPLDAAARTVLNGRQIVGETVIRAGDLLLFGRVGCSIGGERKPAAAAVAKAMPVEHDDRTRVRASLPRFLLRGVSGATLGKTFAITDNAVVGRQPDCDIPLTGEEISRHHARLKVSVDGVHVEDLGSANGTFVNGKRVQSALLKPGEELRLDTVRFLLVTPGMDARQQSAAARVEPAPASAAPGGSVAIWGVVGLVVVAGVAYAALKHLGVI